MRLSMSEAAVLLPFTYYLTQRRFLLGRENGIYKKLINEFAVTSSIIDFLQVFLLLSPILPVFLCILLDV